MLEPWQRDRIIRPLFGWKRANGTRRFRRAYIEVPKKNGKSTMASGVGLALLLADGEMGAEVYSTATDREQASIVHGEAIRMVQASPELSRRLRINATTKNIGDEATQSWYRALPAEAGAAEGKNAHGLIVDELHVWKHKRAFFDALRYGGAARTQPLMFIITTAGEFDETAVGWEEHEYAGKVLDGSIEDWQLLPVIFAADKDGDFADPKQWAKANPSLGITISLDEMEESARDAKHKPHVLNSFKRYRLNLWTAQAQAGMDMVAWGECGGAVDWSKFEGKPCFAGIDLASTSDLCALVLAFEGEMVGDKPTVALLSRFWVPEDAATERQLTNRAPYLTWVGEGKLAMTPGNVTDYGYIRREIDALAVRFKIESIAIDPWNATQFAIDLQAGGHKVYEFRQGFASMNEPSKEFERMMLARLLRHDDHPVLRWMASNVVFDSDPAGNIKPSKSTSRSKIDGIVASIMALGLLRKARPEQSVYDNPNALVWL